ncbi:hypothetical protein PENSPDRAFT_512733 [Peniophora sp. CONT]|nr:hypothetical protein PENSPDRAFT_512733 [Peniophora sp. CONT]
MMCKLGVPVQAVLVNCISASVLALGGHQRDAAKSRQMRSCHSDCMHKQRLLVGMVASKSVRDGQAMLKSPAHKRARCCAFPLLVNVGLDGSGTGTKKVGAGECSHLLSTCERRGFSRGRGRMWCWWCASCARLA